MAAELALAEAVEKYDREARFRKLTGAPAAIAAGLAVGLSLFQLYTAGTGPLEALKQRSLHLTCIMVLAFLLFPATSRGDRRKPAALDWALAGATVATIGYLFYNFKGLVLRNGVVYGWELWLGAAGMLLLLEAARRVLGKEILIMAVAFLAYAYAGRWIPGILGHRGYSVERIIEHMYFGTEGIFGITLAVSATYMFLFILFGAILGATGLSQLINDGAMALAGRSPGGPAKVAVIATGFMGMLNGSAVANAASTGAFTIPVMKRAGYRPEFAAAVEGAGSTGGQIMPPVMGAAAFLIAEFLGIPYAKIIVAAAIPAVLYYLSVWMMVHYEAKKMGLRGLRKDELPDVRAVLRSRGHLLLPVALMIYLLVANYTPLFAGFWAIVSTFAVAWAWEEGRGILARRVPLRSRWYVLVPAAVLAAGLIAGLEAEASAFLFLAAAFVVALLNPGRSPALDALRSSLEQGARGAIGVALATAVVGFVVGAASLTSLGLNLGNAIVKFAGGNLLLALFLTMVTSIVIGTGIPTTPTYIIVALVAAPALIQMNVPALAAHLFVFYYGALADVTPPTALSSYTAAGIAGADPQRTTWIAWKLAMAGFIIPYYFTTNPVLLLNVVPVTTLGLVQAVVSAVVGTVALAMSLQGYALRPAGWIERALLFASALFLIAPGVVNDLVGLLLLAGVLVYQKVFGAVTAVQGPRRSG
ncbi:MAG TPA: TRAP transporter permease [Myxococcales bacterium]|nr:TRAP transporter permease [Myxococcales bacterium]